MSQVVKNRAHRVAAGAPPAVLLLCRELQLLQAQVGLPLGRLWRLDAKVHGRGMQVRPAFHSVRTTPWPAAASGTFVVMQSSSRPSLAELTSEKFSRGQLSVLLNIASRSVHTPDSFLCAPAAAAAGSRPHSKRPCPTGKCLAAWIAALIAIAGRINTASKHSPDANICRAQSASAPQQVNSSMPAG